VAEKVSKSVAKQQEASKSQDYLQEQSNQKTPPGLQTNILALQRAAGNRVVGQLLQAKFAINQPGDEYEREADQMAEQVMRLPRWDAQIQRQSSGDRSDATYECEECPRKQLNLQRRATNLTEFQTAPSIVYDALRSPGQPLDPTTRAFMEPRFEQDFGDVRVHTNGKAAESAEALNAMAFTVGKDIVFGAGEFAPDVSKGRQLIAHELTHTIQQAESPEIRFKLQREPRTTSAIPNVSGVLISCTDNRIVFQTPTTNYTYELTTCSVPIGTYETTVTIRGNNVHWDFGTAISGSQEFHFNYNVEPGQTNPATLFRGQHQVTIDVQESLPISESEPQPTVQQAPTTLEAFKRLVKNAGKVRLAINKQALEQWKGFIQNQLTPTQVQAQARAVEARDILIQGEHSDVSGQFLADQALRTRGPNTRWVLRQQMAGRFRACTGCHALVRAREYDLLLEKQRGAPLPTPLEQLRAAEHVSTTTVAPQPSFAPGAAEQGRIADWAQIAHNPMLPATAETAQRINTIQPTIGALGEQGYQVLPPEVLGSNAAPQVLVEQIIQRINQRQSDYDLLSRQIDDPGFDYLKLRPIVRELLPLADPQVRTAVQEEIDDAETWETIKEIVVGAASIGLLLLIVFPPTTALGVAGALALGAGVSGYQLYSGIESYEQGRLYELSRGTSGVFDPEQQQAADMLMTMGMVNVVMGGIGLAASGLGAVKLFRGPATTAGQLGSLESIEARVGENNVRITGLNSENPHVRVTGPNQEVIYDGPASGLNRPIGAPARTGTPTATQAAEPTGTGTQPTTPTRTPPSQVAAGQAGQIQGPYLMPGGSRLGQVAVPQAPTPLVLGQQIEEPIRQFVAQHYRFTLAPKSPSAVGPDIEIPAVTRAQTGFDIADIKPANSRGVIKFWDQLDNWRDYGWAGGPKSFQGKAALFVYDSQGNVYLYGIFDL